MRRAKVGGFVLPFANPRHAHEFRYVKDLLVDDDQTIVAGVIDTTTNFVEHPEVVADRLERVAAVIGDPHRVMAGTDCGFESIAGKGRVAEDVAWAKLAALSEGRAARVLASVLGRSEVAPCHRGIRQNTQKQQSLEEIPCSVSYPRPQAPRRPPPHSARRSPC